MMVIAGCSNGSSSDSGGNKGGESAEDKTLTIALGTDMVSFDIHNHNNTTTEAIHINLFNYLFKNDENQELQPELVDTYENVDDTTWKFKLKDGVTFHNGDPLTAEDVKFTLERVAKDSSLREYPNYKQILEVRVLNDLEFEIVTDGPQPALLNRLSRIGSGILPKKYIEENGWEEFLKNPVGTGPYKFVEWVRDDRIVFEPYEDYWEGKVDEWDQLVFRVIPEASTRVSELLTGGVDIAANIAPAEWERVNNNDGTSIISTNSNRVIMLGVRQTEGYPTADPRVVEAIDLAIDDKTLTDIVLGGAGTPTRTRVTPGNFGADESLFDTYEYDVDKAKSLLEEAGYPDGFEITFHSPHGRYLQDSQVAETISGMLAEVGIKANIEFMEWSSFVEMRNSKTNKDLYLIGFGNSMFDAALALDLYRSERAAGELDYNNPEVDDLLAKAAINMNPEERAEQYQQIQQIVAEGRPHIYLYQEKSNYGVSDGIDFQPRLDEMIVASHIKRK
ncbi:ABC transporter substrate-binding protein [Bacillaceae bacterium Marseille-Q3522]|nr:ABC transporter substrate-binding protein [Bacillaceae bacterium Marseille-Q3522]